MKFEPVQIHKGSDLEFTARYSSRDSIPHISFLHLAFTGTYRAGAQGTPDAHYITGILKVAEAAWFPSATILDLSELTYEWGDEMARILDTDRIHRFAIIVGNKCRRAMATLKFGMATSDDITSTANIFDSFNDAYAYLATCQVQKWNESDKRIGPPEDWSLITLDDLRIGG
ncbi:MAG: hypothetical protein AAF394_03030 [Planctomycetota bacterium]